MKNERSPKRWLTGIKLLLIAGFVGFVAVQPMFLSYGPHANIEIQNARSIGIAMFQYAIDHEGRYPEGKSSTEIFQKLLDEKYVLDNTQFYLPVLGKIRPELDKPLKPENVCWDVTCCLHQNDSDGLPLVFMTGYRVEYKAGGVAHFIGSEHSRTWLEWMTGKPAPLALSAGIGVCCKSMSTRYAKSSPSSRPVIPNFIALDTDFHGKIYHQLTPNGPLP